jgi:hypothetical protein
MRFTGNFQRFGGEEATLHAAGALILSGGVKRGDLFEVGGALAAPAQE